ncbi:Ig-like domain-containing protein [Rhodococcus spelaei]|nr:Ig-like domain-containing protein [Rhodococcus spelaei]
MNVVGLARSHAGIREMQDCSEYRYRVLTARNAQRSTPIAGLDRQESASMFTSTGRPTGHHCTTRRSAGQRRQSARSLCRTFLVVGAVAATGVLFAATATAAVPTTTTVVVSAGGSVGMYGTGCPVTLTTHTTDSGGIPVPSGTVAFYDNTAPIGTAGVDSTGVANQTWTPTTTGNHQIIAHYFPNGSYLGSFGVPVTVKVTTGVSLGVICFVTPF